MSRHPIIWRVTVNHHHFTKPTEEFVFYFGKVGAPTALDIKAVWDKEHRGAELYGADAVPTRLAGHAVINTIKPLKVEWL